MSSHGDDRSSNQHQSNRDRIAETNARQSDEPGLWLNIEIRTSASQPELLQGLEQWLQLNLISQAQVKKLARNHLSCTVPELPVIPVVTAILEPEPAVATPTSLVMQVWQAFLDELSIRWLLFLGIFLVVVSSGVLAASQWQNFPRFGQYLVLLSYTLGFWGIGFWTSKQDLKLTSQTLSAIATLLIPINFWAISYLGLGQSFIEWIIIAVAVVVTASITRSQKPKLFSIPFWLLSCLHLGWSIAFFPLLSIYSGIAIVSFIYYKFLLPRYSTNLLFILAAWSLLLVRRLSGEIHLAPDYCLAIAIFAWLLATICLTRSSHSKANTVDESAITYDYLGRVGQVFSIILFTATSLGSLLAGAIESPWFFYQTVSINILAIQWFYQRLTLYWRKRDLTAIFSIGLLTVYISKELVPESLRDRIDFAVTVSKTEYLPESVLGVTLFPYVIVFVLVASWLYRRQKPQLALYTEYLTLMLGVILTCLSWSNPVWRSLNLLGSTLTLGYIMRIRQPTRSNLLYLTHLLGLMTIIQAIVIIPNIGQPAWGSILVVLMVVEWSIYLRQTKRRLDNRAILIWQSCWYFGLLLSTVSYGCFWLEAFSQTPNSYWGLLWLVTPITLTAIAKYTKSRRQKRLATSFSCIALIMVQLLVFQRTETRFIGLAIATGLMFVNAFNLRQIVVTIIHLGLGLCLLANLLATFTYGWNWLLIGAITILGLYQLRLYLQQIVDTPKFAYISQRQAHGILGVGLETKNFKLIDKYITATDYWAIAIGAIEIAVLTILYLFGSIDIQFQYLTSIAIVIGAIVWRYYRQPRNWIVYALVWLIELSSVGIVSLVDGKGLTIAIANIIMAAIALVAVRQISKSNLLWQELNLTWIPPIYAALAMLWRLPYHNALTGWLTLGAATILFDTQLKSKRANIAIDYLAYLGISVGVYELVIYRILFLLESSIADSLTILALTAAAIAFSYRLIAWRYGQRPRTRIIFIAHLHWAVASVLKIVAAGIAIENAAIDLTLVSIATSFCLGAYAVIQGRDSSISTSKLNNWWVYVGTVEIAATLIYSRLIIDRLSLFDPWRIVFTCAIALLIYQIPWRNLGWQVTPWQRIATIIPAVMALAIAEDISWGNLLVTALFYLRIAYGQQNIRWSYISLGFIDWGIVRSWQYNLELVWIPVAISISILYIAQLDPYLRSHRRSRHYLRTIGCSIVSVAALFCFSGIVSGALAFALIFIGLGLKIRAFLFTGTITLILSVIYQLIVLVMTYSFLKWIIGLLAGIGSIAIAAQFEKQHMFNSQLKNYGNKLRNWQ